VTATVLRRASTAPGVEHDLVVEGDRVVDAPGPGDHEVVDVEGRPVLPGIVDHHVHLLATAAARDSVDCSPAALDAGGGLGPVLRAARRARPDGWLRGVGYDVAASGDLDRAGLDPLDVGPLRIQDRTGIRWLLDGRALDLVLPPDPGDWPAGVARDAAGRATGVLTRLDGWLGGRIPRQPPDLAALGAWLAGRGVTGVTDAGAGNGPDELAALSAGGLPQRVTAMTGAARVAAPAGVALGPVKILLDDADLPGLAELTGRVAEAHAAGRAVAVHSVSAASLVLALAAGVGRGDRVEHASLVPDEVLPLLVGAGPTVVVQPGLVRTRGDRYLAEVPPADHPGLHRLGSFLAAGLRVLAGSDAPYGDPDPWVGVAAAIDRRTAGGRVLGRAEALDPAAALWLYRGAPAGDLVVLDDGWDRITAGTGDTADTADTAGLAGMSVHAVVIAGRLSRPQTPPGR
jgi:predicted amidohydrolase YtcJ